jgi:nicotinamide-nucleotide amidase
MSDQHYKLAQQLGLQLKKMGWQLAVSESCTGGGLAQAVTAVPAASSWFDRGFVTYSNAAKIELLGVHQETLEKYGAVSEQTAQEMVSGALRNSHADIAISITGIAGPTGGTPEKPVGTVWFALAKKGENPQARLANFQGNRHAIQQSAITFALTWLLEAT